VFQNETPRAHLDQIKAFLDSLNNQRHPRRIGMIKDFISKIIRRLVFVFVLTQAGLIGGIYSLTLISQNEAIYGTTVWYILLSSLILLYGGFMMGLYFLCWPLYTIYRKINTFLRWRDWIITELPKIIALIPSMIQAIKRGFNDQQEVSKRDPDPSEY
jgi:hypothetical protein